MVLDHFASHQSQLKTRRSFTFFQSRAWSLKLLVCQAYHSYVIKVVYCITKKKFRKILQHTTFSINSSRGKRRNEAEKEKKRVPLGQSSYYSGSMFTLWANVSQDQFPPQLLRSKFLNVFVFRRQRFANTVQPHWTKDLTPRHMTSFPSIDRSPLQGGNYHNIDSRLDDHRDVGETQIPTALTEKHPGYCLSLLLIIQLSKLPLQLSTLPNIVVPKVGKIPIKMLIHFHSNQVVIVPKVGNILVIISVVNHTPLKVIIPILSFLISCLNQINKTNIPMSFVYSNISKT